MNADGGVGSGMMLFGDRLSTALSGVFPPDVMEAGVRSWVLLAFEFSTRGAGEPLRSTAGDLGGTCGGNSASAEKLAVSTFNNGFGLATGLMIGDRGFPGALRASEGSGGVVCCA